MKAVSDAKVFVIFILVWYNNRCGGLFVRRTKEKAMAREMMILLAVGVTILPAYAQEGSPNANPTYTWSACVADGNKCGEDTAALVEGDPEKLKQAAALSIPREFWANWQRNNK